MHFFPADILSVGRLQSTRRYWEIGSVSAAKYVSIPDRIDRDGSTKLASFKLASLAATEVGGVTQHRVDDERFGNIISTQMEGHLSVFF